MNTKVIVGAVVVIAAVAGAAYFGTGGAGVGGGLMSAGIDKDSVVNTDNPGLEPQKPEAKTDLYTEAQAIAVPAGLPTELKAILREVCGQVKLIADVLPGTMTGRARWLSFVWKNKPTGEKIESAFVKAGYTVDLAGDIPFFKKDNMIVEVNWSDQMDTQEIVVAIMPEE